MTGPEHVSLTSSSSSSESLFSMFKNSHPPSNTNFSGSSCARANHAMRAGTYPPREPIARREREHTRRASQLRDESGNIPAARASHAGTRGLRDPVPGWSSARGPS
eukprot:623486-Prorocentrum_minimum.AAC.1